MDSWAKELSLGVWYLSPVIRAGGLWTDKGTSWGMGSEFVALHVKGMFKGGIICYL